MSRIGKKTYFNETVNVPVMHRLSSDPAIPVDFKPFLVKALLGLVYISVLFGQD